MKKEKTDFLHHESSLKKRRQYGSTLDECFRKFSNKTADLYIMSSDLVFLTRLSKHIP